MLLNYTDDYNRSILFSVYDYDKKKGKHFPMGNMKTTVNILLASLNATNTTNIMLPMHNNKGKACGNIMIYTIKVIENDAATSDQRQQQCPIFHPSAPPSSTGPYLNDIHKQVPPSCNPHYKVER